MAIQRDVYGVALFFGIDPSLLQAVATTEGDIVRAIQRALPSVTMHDTALSVTARFMVHAMMDWLKTSGTDSDDRRRAFIAFWAKRWATLCKKNDAKNVTADWASNVNRLWTPVNP